MTLAYWWRAKPNFGDELTHWLLDGLGVSHRWAAAAESDLVVTGSVLEHLPANWTGTVVGAGQLRPESAIDLSAANVLALRGKLTAGRVNGVADDVVLGDPGLLVSHLVPRAEPRYDLGIVPHWSDKDLARRFGRYGRVIDPAGPPEQVIAEIASCRSIISSSLHGLIVADAYGIPRRAELFEQAAREGGDWKFRDYASVFDGDPHFGHAWQAPADIVRRIQQDLLRVFTEWLHRRERPQISLLVPFRDDGEHRTRVWQWLKRYWADNLRSVEIVEGHDDGTPFSKAVAVNDAASRARGRVFVVLDADAYMDAQAVQNCADRIEAAVAAGQRMWYMPYNKLFRLSRDVTLRLLSDDPAESFDLPCPPPADWCDRGGPQDYCDYGHDFGAMMLVMPAEAFAAAGGMDPRFRGWGSEDAALLWALDTLYCRHEIARRDIFHLWHVRVGSTWRTRRWVGQDSGHCNAHLGSRYAQAFLKPDLMRQLVQERAA